MDEFLQELSVTEITLGATGFVALVAFLIFIAGPAWGSYGRVWERVAAGFLAVYIGATLLGVGVVAGIGIFALYVEFVSS